ncbi:Thiol:disulfide interchange protein TlpA [Enhygromyxa salina]|uniref:Thiol:disulfide interchange protein TlpA n=1 Tax=Enhygromyxa salina TaxID=215803 RepID=A0A2S9XZL9_9BACT|nr:TlpA family protein disulfide reductase [Enhygromyxa salina]PRP98289.1 Thiol:disulfide interchange protein TlpA [Enhygromyxa salina]
MTAEPDHQAEEAEAAKAGPPEGGEALAEEAAAGEAVADEAVAEEAAADGAAAGEAVVDEATAGEATAGEAAAGEAAAGEPTAKPRVSIPPPKPAAAGEKGARRGLDSVAILAMLVFVLVGGLLVFGFAQALVPAAEAQLGAACRPLSPSPASGPVPELELEDLDGNPVSLDDFRGKFLVVNFWATWCEPCTREWPDLDVLASRLGERDDLAVIAISVDQEPELIGPYLERMGLLETEVKILRAKPPDAHQLFGSEKIPDTYFVSPEGELEAVFVNVREWGKAKGVRCVEASAEQSH